jgi:uncharacterized protein
MIRIPINELSQEALHAILEAYVLREGTDYGTQDVALEVKVQQLKSQLEKNDIVLVYDQTENQCNLMVEHQWSKLVNDL